MLEGLCLKSPAWIVIFRPWAVYLYGMKDSIHYKTAYTLKQAEPSPEAVLCCRQQGQFKRS